MVKAAILGSLGTILGGVLWRIWPHPWDLLYLPKIIVYAFPVCILIAGPLLALAALPLGWAQDALRRRVRSWIAAPLAILLGVPFGMVVCSLILKFFGMRGTPWTNPKDWLFWMPEAVGAGLGLGWGRLRKPAAHE